MSKFKIEVSTIKNNKGLLSISNDIVKTRYKLSLPTQKLLLFLISEINFEEKKTGIFVKEQKHDLKKIFMFFKEAGSQKDKNLKGKLKECIKEFDTNVIEIQKINEFKQEIWEKFPWYSKISLNEEEGSFVFKFNNDISSLLLNLKSYFKSNLKEYLAIKSTHAIDLYTLLRAEEFTNPEKKYPLEYLKLQLGISENKRYKRWDNVKTDILEKSITQLNKETDYFFSYDIKRVGRKVGFVIFTMIEKKDIKKLSELVTENFEKLMKEQKLLSFFREKRLYNILYKYDPIEDKLTLDIRKTAINPKYIYDFDLWLVKIGFQKKIISKIFRKSTVLSFITK